MKRKRQDEIVKTDDDDLQKQTRSSNSGDPKLITDDKNYL